MKKITIGRNSSNDIVINDTMVSRFHCEIIQESGTIKIVDLNSSNGTFVNGQRISGAVDLTPQDTVCVHNISVNWQEYFTTDDDGCHERHKKNKKWFWISLAVFFLIMISTAIIVINKKQKAHDAQIAFEQRQSAEQSKADEKRRIAEGQLRIFKEQDDAYEQRLRDEEKERQIAEEKRKKEEEERRIAEEKRKKEEERRIAEEKRKKEEEERRIAEEKRKKEEERRKLEEEHKLEKKREKKNSKPSWQDECYILDLGDGWSLAVQKEVITTGHVYKDADLLAKSSRLGGYIRWRLPSKDEMALIFSNMRDKIPSGNYWTTDSWDAYGRKEIKSSVPDLWTSGTSSVSGRYVLLKNSYTKECHFYKELLERTYYFRPDKFYNNKNGFIIVRKFKK